MKQATPHIYSFIQGNLPMGARGRVEDPGTMQLSPSLHTQPWSTALKGREASCVVRSEDSYLKRYCLCTILSPSYLKQCHLCNNDLYYLPQVASSVHHFRENQNKPSHIPVRAHVHLHRALKEAPREVTAWAWIRWSTKDGVSVLSTPRVSLTSDPR